jgi:hypothetical protein
MTPALFLILTAAITVGAIIAQFIVRAVLASRLKTLAAEHDMHYCSDDRFHLAPNVAQHLPCPGAADVRVRDLIYGLSDHRFLYIFTAEYTRGAVRTKKRLKRVVAVTEPKDRSQRQQGMDMILADESQPILQQYQHLADQLPNKTTGPATVQVTGP